MNSVEDVAALLAGQAQRKDLELHLLRRRTKCRARCAAIRTGCARS